MMLHGGTTASNKHLYETRAEEYDFNIISLLGIGKKLGICFSNTLAS